MTKFRWSAEPEVRWGDCTFEVGLNRIEVPYIMEIHDQFAQGCKLEVRRNRTSHIVERTQPGRRNRVRGEGRPSRGARDPAAAIPQRAGVQPTVGSLAWLCRWNQCSALHRADRYPHSLERCRVGPAAAQHYGPIALAAQVNKLANSREFAGSVKASGPRSPFMRRSYNLCLPRWALRVHAENVRTVRRRAHTKDADAVLLREQRAQRFKVFDRHFLSYA